MTRTANRVFDLRWPCLVACLAGAAPGVASAASPAGGASDTRWFQATEQSLMDAIGAGDKSPWAQIMDPQCIVTTEQGEVVTRQAFLDELRALPAGLSGGITVRDLRVQPFPGFAVVRFLADEQEDVFGQRLAIRYRVTDTFRRAGRKWKMVSSHVSVVTADPPPQPAAKGSWPGFVGTYQLLPDGWRFHVELRDGTLYGGRDPAQLRPFVPVTPDVLVLSGSLGEWIFVTDETGTARRLVSFRKFNPLVWTRIEEKRPSP
jgi:uncharacterized protein DUF4440